MLLRICYAIEEKKPNKKITEQKRQQQPKQTGRKITFHDHRTNESKTCTIQSVKATANTIHIACYMDGLRFVSPYMKNIYSFLFLCFSQTFTTVVYILPAHQQYIHNIFLCCQKSGLVGRL